MPEQPGSDRAPRPKAIPDPLKFRIIRTLGHSERFLHGQDLEISATPSRPSTYVPALELEPSAARQPRVEAPRASVEWRRRNFAEVEVGFSVAEARREAERCLRCDLEFTAPPDAAAPEHQAKG